MVVAASPREAIAAGGEVIHWGSGKNVFRFEPGPISGNIIVGDDIYRAPAQLRHLLGRRR